MQQKFHFAFDCSRWNNWEFLIEIFHRMKFTFLWCRTYLWKDKINLYICLQTYRTYQFRCAFSREIADYFMMQISVKIDLYMKRSCFLEMNFLQIVFGKTLKNCKQKVKMKSGALDWVLVETSRVSALEPWSFAEMKIPTVWVPYVLPALPGAFVFHVGSDVGWRRQSDKKDVWLHVWCQMGTVRLWFFSKSFGFIRI